MQELDIRVGRYLFSCRTVAVGCNPAELLLPIQLAILVLIVQVLEPHGFLNLPPGWRIPCSKNKALTRWVSAHSRLKCVISASKVAFMASPSPRTSPMNSLRPIYPSLSASYSAKTSSMVKSFEKNKVNGFRSERWCLMLPDQDRKSHLQPCDPLLTGE